MDSGSVVWLTGLSGAGKSTVGDRLRRLLLDRGVRPIVLDGDRIRATVTTPVGYTEQDRRRMGAFYGRLARELAGQGHTVICATISLFHDVQRWNRENLPGYLEVLLRVPAEELRRRDSKGLYRGRPGDVAGIDVKAEFPRRPDVVIDNAGSTTPELAAASILHELARRELP
jgi:adenylylsulfate kinase-like enzyme